MSNITGLKKLLVWIGKDTEYFAIYAWVTVGHKTAPNIKLPSMEKNWLPTDCKYVYELHYIWFFFQASQDSINGSTSSSHTPTPSEVGYGDIVTGPWPSSKLCGGAAVRICISLLQHSNHYASLTPCPRDDFIWTFRTSCEREWAWPFSQGEQCSTRTAQKSWLI